MNPTNLTHCHTTSRQLDSSTRLDQRNNQLIYQVDEPNLPTHCQTTSRQLDTTRPTQQPAYLSRRSTQLTSLTATQHLDSSTARRDSTNATTRLIYQVDEPNLPTHCQTTSRQLDATRPMQQPAYLSSRSTQLTSLTATRHLDSSTRLTKQPAYL